MKCIKCGSSKDVIEKYELPEGTEYECEFCNIGFVVRWWDKK